MNKEDFISCLTMGNHGGIPTFLYDTSLGTHYANIPVSSIYGNGRFDGRLSAESILASKEVLGHDAVVGAVDCTDIRAFGGEFEYYPDRRPVCTKRPFDDIAEMDAHSPEEISGTVDSFVESYDIVCGKDDCAVVATIPSPFLSAALHRGLEPLMLDIASNRYDYEKEMRFATAVSDIITERLLSETDADAVLIPGAYDNVDLVGMEIMEKDVIPTLAHLHDSIRPFGLPEIFHPHGILMEGKGIDALELFVKVGFDCIYYGEGNDYRRMMELCRDKVSTMGGVDTFTTIFLGPDERVIKDTEDVVSITKDHNHVFTCSCSVDRGLDTHRMELMMKTVRGGRNGQ